MALLLAAAGGLQAQDATQAPADLKFTQDVMAHYHTVASVTTEMPDGTAGSFQYDRYPATVNHGGAERIKTAAGVFARKTGQAWLKSNDWGETGTPPSDDLAQQLDFDVEIMGVPFLPGTNKDSTQGGTVWRYVSQDKAGKLTRFTFAESREHPIPGRLYPQYTFMKAPGDLDGRLFLCGMKANVRLDAGLMPVTLKMTYLVPIPAGSKVQVFDQVTGKEKVNTVVGADSGWEITTERSEPPAVP
jgi:hypothetical protein